MSISEKDVRHALAENATGLDDPWTVPADEPLNQYGVDSLDMYTTIAELQEETGKEPTDEEFSALKTINSIVRFFS